MPHEKTLLDETFEAIDTPAGMRLQLLPHQQRVVAAILRLEDRRILTMMNDSEIQSSAIVLSEPFGSGKTVELLAVILHKPIPQPWPELSSIGNHVISKEYTKLINSTLVVVGSSVLVQWKKAILEHTVLSVMCISSYYDLCSFIKKYNNAELTEDIVLLKNGPISGKLDSDILQTRSSIQAMTNITKGYCWARVIYDDFDVIKISQDDHVMPSLSTIYVSATKKLHVGHSKPRYRQSSEDDQITTMADLDYHPKLSSINNRYKNYLFSNFNIRCKKNFLDSSLTTPKIYYYKYVFDSKHARYAKLIGSSILDSSSSNIVEMLNGDAVKTAAKSLNIDTTSISDIFQKVLDQKYDSFIRDQRLIVSLQKAIAAYEVLPNIQHDELFPNIQHNELSKDKIADIISAIKGHRCPTLEARTPQLMTTLKTLLATTEQARDANGLAISRVLSNIKEGDCQICYESLANTAVFINKCCGVILCQMCGIRGNRLEKTRYGLQGSNIIQGSCPMCRHTLTISDLLFVDKSVNLESLMTAVGDEKDEFVVAVEPKQQQTMFSKAEVIAILIGDTSSSENRPLIGDTSSSENRPQAIPIERQISNLMCGTTIIDDIPSLKKICVFANYDESLSQIEKALDDKGVSYMRLKGTAKQMDEIVQAFRTGNTQALLINSMVKCAGLNLEFMTDLIFCHLIHDKAIEGQVLGRGQRYGRTSNLRVHYLCYTHEQ